MKKYMKNLLKSFFAGAMIFCTSNITQSQVIYAPPVQKKPNREKIIFKDHNRDGIEDLLYAQFREKGFFSSSEYYLMIAEGDKNWKFNPPKELFSFGKFRPTSISIRDCNKDGIEDLLYVQFKEGGFLGISSSNGYYLMIAEGDKNGNFNPPKELFFFGKQEPF